MQHMQHRAINVGTAGAAFFISHIPRITQHCQDEAMLDARQMRGVDGKPSNRTDGRGRKHKAIGVPGFDIA